MKLRHVVGYIGFITFLLGMLICIMGYEVWDMFNLRAIVFFEIVGFSVFISGAIMYAWAVKK